MPDAPRDRDPDPVADLLRAGFLAARHAASGAVELGRAVARQADDVLTTTPGGDLWSKVRDAVFRQVDELRARPIGVDPSVVLDALRLTEAERAEQPLADSVATLVDTVVGTVSPSGSAPAMDATPTNPADQSVDAEEVRDRFTELLRTPTATGPAPRAPSFATLVDRLDPDEARIIRFLAGAPRQPAVDVIEVTRLGAYRRTVARTLSSIADDAGCHEPGRAADFLQNLAVLGLVDLEDEPCAEDDAYERLEARPDVGRLLRAAESGTRRRVTRRCVRLSASGTAFVAVCVAASG